MEVIVHNYLEKNSEREGLLLFRGRLFGGWFLCSGFLCGSLLWLFLFLFAGLALFHCCFLNEAFFTEEEQESLFLGDFLGADFLLFPVLFDFIGLAQT